MMRESGSAMSREHSLHITIEFPSSWPELLASACCSFECQPAGQGTKLLLPNEQSKLGGERHHTKPWKWEQKRCFQEVFADHLPLPHLLGLPQSS